MSEPRLDGAGGSFDPIARGQRISGRTSLAQIRADCCDSRARGAVAAEFFTVPGSVSTWGKPDHLTRITIRITTTSAAPAPTSDHPSSGLLANRPRRAIRGRNEVVEGAAGAGKAGGTEGELGAEGWGWCAPEYDFEGSAGNDPGAAPGSDPDGTLEGMG